MTKGHYRPASGDPGRGYALPHPGGKPRLDRTPGADPEGAAAWQSFRRRTGLPREPQPGHHHRHP